MSTTGMQTSARADAGRDSSFAGIPVKITNNLSVPLEIYDVFNPAASGQTTPYLYTKLGTIAAGATGTVKTIRLVSQLEAMYTGTIPELLGWYYHQFPIKLMSGTQFSFGNPPPLSYTIADSDRESMIQSFLFHKFAMANPDSALTKNLNTALQSSDPTAVNTFFAGTKNFKSCTLSSWNAVMTWLTMFTSGWQGPYYLYEAAPSDPPQNYAPTLLATLNVVSTASANLATLTLCSQDASGKIQPLSPAQTSTVVMAGDGTMVDQNPGQDVACTLTPVWMTTTQTTMEGNQPQTTYIAGPAITGTVAGTNVVSTQTVIPLPSQAQSGSQSPGFFSGQTFNTICEVTGLLVGLVMIYELAEKRLSGKQQALEEARNDATSKSDLNNKIEAIDKNPSDGTAEVIIKNADTIATDSAKAKGCYTKISQIQQEKVLTQAINRETQTLNKKISSELTDGLTPTPAFETATSEATAALSTVRTQINDGELPKARITMTEAASSMQQTLDQSASQMNKSERETVRNSAKEITIATDQAGALSEAQNQYDKNMGSEANDSGAPNTDTAPDIDPIAGR
jgi:hypothetical protein